jgi:hypothetical protein
VRIERNILKNCWKVCKYRVIYFFNKKYLPEIDDLISLSRFLKTAELTKIIERKLSSIDSYQSSYWTNFKVNGFYRSRVHNSIVGNKNKLIETKFEDEGEFWNPIPKYATLGRCNDKGESLLYCSTSWETAILETKPYVGSFISVTNFRVKKNVEQGSRIQPIGIQYLSRIPSFKDNNMFENYNFNRSDDFIKIDNFLDKLFHEKVDNKNNNLYKLSIAVTKCMMKNIMMGDSIMSMNGIAYSSIERDLNNYNLLFRPSHARQLFSLFEIQTFEVIEKTETKLKLQLKRIGKPIGIKHHLFDNVAISWLNLNHEEKQIENINLNN